MTTLVPGVPRAEIEALVLRANHPDPRVWWDAPWTVRYERAGRLDGALVLYEAYARWDLLNLITAGDTPRQRYRTVLELAQDSIALATARGIGAIVMRTRVDVPWYPILRKILGRVGFQGPHAAAEGAERWTLPLR